MWPAMSIDFAKAWFHYCHLKGGNCSKRSAGAWRRTERAYAPCLDMPRLAFFGSLSVIRSGDEPRSAAARQSESGEGAYPPVRRSAREECAVRARSGSPHNSQGKNTAVVEPRSGILAQGGRKGRNCLQRAFPQSLSV